MTFPLTQSNLRYWNSSSNAWATATDSYGISVGDSETSLPLSGTLSVTSAELGQPVTIASPGAQEGIAGTAVSVAVTGSDSTSGQTLSYSATGLPAGTSISGTYLPSDANTDGTRVDLYTCNGTGAQVWQPQSDGALLNPQSGKCLDDTGSGGSGTQVQIWDCTGASSQQWTLP